MKVTVILSITLMVLANGARSEIYKYMDKNGTVIFTDDASKIRRGR